MLTENILLFERKTGTFIPLKDIKRGMALDSIRAGYPTWRTWRPTEDGQIVHDWVKDLLDTGVREVHAVELENGLKFSCTKEHKFFCSQGQFFSIADIQAKGLYLAVGTHSYRQDRVPTQVTPGLTTPAIPVWQHVKIKSITSLGQKQTFNIRMKRWQHNFLICQPDNDYFIIAVDSAYA